MALDREWLDENLAAYALGALDPEENARMEMLLANDPERRRSLDEYRATVDLFPLALAPVEPPREARESILASVRRARATPTETRAPRRVSLTWIAIAAVILIALTLWNLDLRRRADDARRDGARDAFTSIAEGQVVLLAGHGTPAAQGRILIGSDRRSGKLVVAGLAPLAQNRVYQLWFVRKDASPDSGGTFQVDERGRAILDVRATAAVDDLVAIAVTEEPAPGVPGPTGAHVLDVVR